MLLRLVTILGRSDGQCIYLVDKSITYIRVVTRLHPISATMTGDTVEVGLTRAHWRPQQEIGEISGLGLQEEKTPPGERSLRATRAASPTVSWPPKSRKAAIPFVSPFDAHFGCGRGQQPAPRDPPRQPAFRMTRDLSRRALNASGVEPVSYTHLTLPTKRIV